MYPYNCLVAGERLRRENGDIVDQVETIGARAELVCQVPDQYNPTDVVSRLLRKTLAFINS